MSYTSGWHNPQRSCLRVRHSNLNLSVSGVVAYTNNTATSGQKRWSQQSITLRHTWPRCEVFTAPPAIGKSQGRDKGSRRVAEYLDRTAEQFEEAVLCRLPVSGRGQNPPTASKRMPRQLRRTIKRCKKPKNHARRGDMLRSRHLDILSAMGATLSGDHATSRSRKVKGHLKD